MSDVTIHHMRSTYRLPPGAADPAVVAAELDRVASALVAPSLEALAGRHDPRLYFLESVDVDVRVNPRGPAAAAATAAADAWAGAIRRRVTQALASDPTVVVFADRAAFVAAFLADLLHGRAAGIWYYRELEGLLALPHGDASAQLLLRDPDTGRDALLELSRGPDLEPLLAVMTDAQADELANRCLLPAGARGFNPASAESWLRAVRAAAPGSEAETTRHRGRALILLYTAVLRKEPGLGPDQNLARFLDGLLRLSELLAGASDRQAFIEDVSQGGARLARLARDVPSVSGIVRSLGPRARELLAETITLLAPPPGGPPVTTEFSQFAGLLLLVPSVLELGLDERLGATAGEKPLASQTLLYGLAIECLGPEARATARRDPAPRLLAGLPVAPTETQAADAARRFECSGGSLAALADEVMTAFAARLGAFAGSSADFLRANFLFSTGTASVSDHALTVGLDACPLRVVLQMAGFGRGEWSVSWFGGRRLTFRLE